MSTAGAVGAVVDGVDALTADGGIVTIRPIRGSDQPGITALYGNASADNLRLRFFDQPSSGTLAAGVDRLCRPESDRRARDRRAQLRLR